MHVIKLWEVFKSIYKRVTYHTGLSMSLVSDTLEPRVVDATRFQARYQVADRLSLDQDYYFCRDSENEYHIFVKLRDLYQEVNEIVIE